jgi:hypothetical protein
MYEVGYFVAEIKHNRSGRGRGFESRWITLKPPNLIFRGFFYLVCKVLVRIVK